MSKLEEAAIDWYNRRKAFLDAQDRAGTLEFTALLNAATDGEHNLAAAVRMYNEQKDE